MTSADAVRELAIISDLMTKYTNTYGRFAYYDLMVYEAIPRVIESNTEVYGGDYTATTDADGAMEKIIDAGLRVLGDMRWESVWDATYERTSDALLDDSLGVFIERDFDEDEEV